MTIFLAKVAVRNLIPKTLLYVSFVCLFANTAQARPFRPEITSGGRALVINGQAILLVPGSAGPERAKSAAIALRESGSSHAIAHRISRRKYTVTTSLGDKVLTVTRADAKDANETVQELAVNWATEITHALAGPAIYVALKQKVLIVPTGEFRSIVVGGAARSDEITATNSAASVALSSFDRSTRTLTVQGIKPGLIDVTLEAEDGHGGSAEKNIPILVEDQAGTIDSFAAAPVTGSPTSKDLVLQAVRTAVYRSVSLHPGAFLEVSKQPDVEGDLLSGESVDIPVTVRAVGADLIPVENTVTVHVQNESNFPAETAQTLFYSNNPETVKHPQTLFDASIPTVNQPVRLVFHHQDISSSPMIMRVELINIGQYPANIQIIRGLAGSYSNPVDAGAVAGSQFFREWKDNSGELMTVPQQSRLEILVLRTNPGDVASGIVEVAQLSGGEHTLLFHVSAEPVDSDTDDGMDTLVKIPDPAKAALALLPLSSAYHSSIVSISSSDQIYSNPTVTVTGAYTVGGSWMHLIIGTDNPIGRQVGGGALLGNYGVIYDVTINLTNPTTIRRQIELSFASGAGDVSGIFGIIGGATTTVNDLQPPNEQEITRITLQPGAAQSVQLQTVPLSGSAYPAAIIAHAL